MNDYHIVIDALTNFHKNLYKIYENYKDVHDKPIIEFINLTTED